LIANDFYDKFDRNFIYKGEKKITKDGARVNNQLGTGNTFQVSVNRELPGGMSNVLTD